MESPPRGRGAHPLEKAREHCQGQRWFAKSSSLEGIGKWSLHGVHRSEGARVSGGRGHPGSGWRGPLETDLPNGGR